MNREDQIRANLERLREELFKTNPSTRLVAVTKYSPIQDVELAYLCEQRDFGENRVQELNEKAQELKHLKDLNWHFQGNIQSNKIKALLEIPNLAYIHSVHRFDILKKMMEHLKDDERPWIGIFLQVNTSGEKEKGGVESKEELLELLELFKQNPNHRLQLKGLMTMGSIRADSQSSAAEQSFSKLNLLAEDLEEHHGSGPLKLSMGMSGDYKIALKHGADFVRIGSSIFK